MGYSAEDKLTIACVRWFKFQYPKAVIYHTPNGGKRNKREAAKFKKMGVLAGVSDITITTPSELYHGLFIELKPSKNVKGTLTRDDYPRPSQREFLNTHHELGYAVAVAWTLDEFMGYVNDYMNNKPVVCDYLVGNGHITIEP